MTKTTIVIDGIDPAGDGKGRVGAQRSGATETSESPGHPIRIEGGGNDVCHDEGASTE